MAQSIDIKKPIRKYLPYFIEARDSNLSEADTVLRLTKVFEEILGYDPMREITREQVIKDKYVDLAIKIDGVVQFLIEVKATNQKLRDKHIEQAQNYAAHGNIQWVLLTNGLDWVLYHLTFDDGIQYDKAFEVSITDNGPDFDKACDAIAILHKKSVGSHGLEEFWERSHALSPASIVKVLFSEEVIAIVRRELRKTMGLRIDEEPIASAIHRMFSVETRELVGPARIRRKRKQRVAKEKGEGVVTKEVEIVESAIDMPEDEEEVAEA